jgi:hypothetical protein
VTALALHRPFGPGGHPGTGAAANPDPTALAEVTRQDLSSQTQVSATLGYAGRYTVVNQSKGTVTALPGPGEVVRQGHPLYQVSGQPVLLLYGSAPAYRSLSTGLTGADVSELNADLVALGYAKSANVLSRAGYFSSWTRSGVAKLQTASGMAGTGALTLGQAVFLPTSVRVTGTSALLGGLVHPGEPVMQGTTTVRQVTIALAAADQSEVRAGDKVAITLPDNRTTPGVISAVGSVAVVSPSGSAGGPPTIVVLVKPARPAATGTWDQAPVNVTITTGRATNVLVVPIDALLAQPGEGYALEVAAGHSRHQLVPVALGLFDDADGLVQVSGAGLSAGQRVVVPNL